MLVPVVLCGGSGSRLWPLSRRSLPKQFIELVGTQSLLQLTLERLLPLVNPVEPRLVCVSSDEHRFLVDAAGRAIGLRIEQLLEPQPRNTAAAMVAAALSVPGPTVLLFCPADHHIPDTAAFCDMVRHALPTAEKARLVIFGVQPSSPSVGYGYIERGLAHPMGGEAVVRFVEKPSQALATEMLASGRFLWNAGIFLLRADALLQAMAEFAPDILHSCRAAMDSAQRDGRFLRPEPLAFANCRSQSIDYAVMEKSQNVSVFPFNGAWSDVGNWASVAALTEADALGNRTVGAAVLVDAQRTFVRAHQRTVVALGTCDLVIVDTPDALLVAATDQVERVKDVVARLEQQANPLATAHRKVARPWGWYDSIDSGAHFQVKRLCVRPGASISLQYHRHRAEHWVVVCGIAKVTKGDEVFELRQGESTYIAAGVVHRLENPAAVDLEMIEVQSGSYLGEDDIVRLQDNYGRADANLG